MTLVSTTYSFHFVPQTHCCGGLPFLRFLRAKSSTAFYFPEHFWLIAPSFHCQTSRKNNWLLILTACFLPVFYRLASLYTVLLKVLFQLVISCCQNQWPLSGLKPLTHSATFDTISLLTFHDFCFHFLPSLSSLLLWPCTYRYSLSFLPLLPSPLVPQAPWEDFIHS